MYHYKFNYNSACHFIERKESLIIKKGTGTPNLKKRKGNS